VSSCDVINIFDITIVIVSSISILYIIEIEQQLLREQSRYIPERVVFVDGQLSEFFGGTQEIKKLSSPEEVQKFITTLMKSNLSYGDMHDSWESAEEEFVLMESRSFRANTGAVSLDSDAFPVPSMAYHIFSGR